jgi:predicted TIM-barrel fold metal-dependent hydrolase
MIQVCDSHVHVFDPARFPYIAPRHFTPGTANVAALKKHLRDCGATRAVIVQPSVYGTRNDCLADALRQMGHAARGVAVVDRLTTDEQLEALDAAGVRGARINMVVDGQADVAAAEKALHALDRQIPPSWHIQLHVPMKVAAALGPVIAQSRRRFVIDHFALFDIGEGLGAAQMPAFLDVVATGRVYVKLSAPYLLSRAAPYDALRGFVDALLARRPDRLLWGTNWPHTQGTARNPLADQALIEPFRSHDDLAWKSICSEWAGERAGEMLASNAAALYGFDVGT